MAFEHIVGEKEKMRVTSYQPFSPLKTIYFRLLEMCVFFFFLEGLTIQGDALYQRSD